MTYQLTNELTKLINQHQIPSLSYLDVFLDVYLDVYLVYKNSLKELFKYKMPSLVSQLYNI